MIMLVLMYENTLKMSQLFVQYYFYPAFYAFEGIRELLDSKCFVNAKDTYNIHKTSCYITVLFALNTNSFCSLPSCHKKCSITSHCLCLENMVNCNA